MKLFETIGCLSLLIAASLSAAPAQVILIRHAEKPATGEDLDAQGWRRAYALVGFFEKNPAMTQHGTPVAIYAMDPGGPDGTQRPIETVTPLAADLKLPILHPYTRKQLPELVAEILGNSAYDGRMVLVCWEHKVIPELVQDFGWNDGPDTWPDDVFDEAWVLGFSGDRVVSFQNVPQHLLPGDNDSTPGQN
jgi:hypothetical protein